MKEDSTEWPFRCLIVWKFVQLFKMNIRVVERGSVARRSVGCLSVDPGFPSCPALSFILSFYCQRTSYIIFFCHRGFYIIFLAGEVFILSFFARELFLLSFCQRSFTSSFFARELFIIFFARDVFFILSFSCPAQKCNFSGNKKII